MKILHYSLGLPPYRSGGLTKYSVDLMQQQMKMKNEVCLLYPGKIRALNKNVKIVKNKSNGNMEVYELINPVPVPLLGGVAQPSMFYKKASKEIYIKFLRDLKLDIIHIHTLMGIHEEFFIAAKELDIKLIYTTHDYYGICPKVNLIDGEYNICTDYKCGQKCVDCNKNAYSFKLIYLMQSHIYRKLKDSNLVKKLRNYKKSLTKEKESNNISTLSDANPMHYEKFREFHIRNLNYIDYFHFNSNITKEVYEKYIRCKGKVISITHSNIKDYRKINKFGDNLSNLNISYLGPIEVYKGINLLIDSLEELRRRGINKWILNIYGSDTKIASIKDIENYNFAGYYKYSELKNIFGNTDILIVPSVCNETFGYVALEALSYGVPVMITENTGAKDLITNNVTGIIVNPDKEKITSKLKEIIENRNILASINKNIVKSKFEFSMDKHTEEIIKLYNEILKVGV